LAMSWISFLNSVNPCPECEESLLTAISIPSRNRPYRHVKKIKKLYLNCYLDTWQFVGLGPSQRKQIHNHSPDVFEYVWNSWISQDLSCRKHFSHKKNM
jgi:hypothetical protein